VKISSEQLKQNLLIDIDRPFSRKFTRFIEALIPLLIKPEYGADGLLYACAEVLRDPANDFDRRDGHDLLKRLAGNGYAYFRGNRPLEQDFHEAVRLWLGSPGR